MLIGAAKIFVKELNELVARPYLGLWLLLIPIGFIYVAGNSNVKPQSIGILVTSAPHGVPSGETVFKLVSEFVNTEVMMLPKEASLSPINLIVANAKIAIVWKGHWHILIRPQNSKEREALLSFAYQIALSIGSQKPFQVKLFEVSSESEIDDLFIEKTTEIQIVDFGAAQVESNKALVPRMIALLVVFIPFLLASNVITRERENGTLASLLVVPGVSWWSMIIGKIMICLFMALVNLLILLLCAVAFFGFLIRQGFMDIILIQLLAIAISTLTGIAVSAIVRTQLQAYFVSTLYAFGLVFLSGILFPLELSTEVIQSVSRTLPLTYSQNNLSQWMIFGLPVWPSFEETKWLFIQLASAAGLAFICLIYARKRI